jgi:hypothetical protein
MESHYLYKSIKKENIIIKVKSERILIILIGIL